jgi:predicted nucleic acid-binding protein
MIVVADTSPISDLVLIKEIDILPKIYGAVVVPEIVARELR